MNLTRFFKNVKLHFIATINKVKLCKKKNSKGRHKEWSIRVSKTIRHILTNYEKEAETKIVAARCCIHENKKVNYHKHLK